MSATLHGPEFLFALAALSSLIAAAHALRSLTK